MPTRYPDRFLRSIRPVVDPAQRAEPGYPSGTVDLRDFRWVTPAAMVVIAALAHRAVRSGAPFAVQGPVRAEPAGYAARMHLGVTLDTLGVQHDLRNVAERDQRGNLLEVTAVRSDADADRLAALVYRKVQGRDRGLAEALHRSIGEIGANVADHAGTIGFVAAQTMPRRDVLTLAVADTGVGLLHTLVRRGATDDEQAIELAVRPDVSQFDDPTRGLGLPTSLRVVRELAGSLYIASGAAAIRHDPRRRRFLHSEQPYPGTVVIAEIPLADRRPA